MKALLWVLGTVSVCLLLSVPSSADEPPQPRYPKPVERPRPPTGPDGKPLVTVDGRWYSQFGYMDLVQDGWNFAGTYSCCGGKIRGEFVADQIEFFWEDPIYGKGWGYFRLQEEGQRLAGTWGTGDSMGSEGGWMAVRLEEREYAGEPSRYRFTAGDLSGEVVLHFSGDEVRGELAGASQPADEKTARLEVLRYLEGRRDGDEIALTWHDPLERTSGEIRLRRDGKVLRGLWVGVEITLRPLAP